PASMLVGLVFLLFAACVAMTMRLASKPTATPGRRSGAAAPNDAAATVAPQPAGRPAESDEPSSVLHPARALPATGGVAAAAAPSPAPRHRMAAAAAAPQTPAEGPRRDQSMQALIDLAQQAEF